MTDEFIAQDVLRTLVDEADQAGLANIRACLGGPFGSLLVAVNVKTGELTRIGQPAGNRVLSTGIPIAHAEDQAMDAARLSLLRSVLKQQGAADSAVILASSAESCPACHAKAETLCRLLIGEGLLRPGRFLIAYGAGVRETMDVAGFNDELYLNDIMAPPDKRLVRITRAKKDAVPDDVCRLMEGGRAVVARADGRLFAGADERARHFILIPEMSAVYAACLDQKNNNVPQPWKLNGAVIYSFTSDPGPMAYTVCQWANVQSWVAVEGGPQIQEVPGIGNAALFGAVAQRPYNGPGTQVRVVHIQPFANLTQKEWRDTLAKGGTGLEIYNGIEAE